MTDRGADARAAAPFSPLSRLQPRPSSQGDHAPAGTDRRAVRRRDRQADRRRPEAVRPGAAHRGRGAPSVHLRSVRRAPESAGAGAVRGPAGAFTGRDPLRVTRAAGTRDRDASEHEGGPPAHRRRTARAGLSRAVELERAFLTGVRACRRSIGPRGRESGATVLRVRMRKRCRRDSAHPARRAAGAGAPFPEGG